MAKPVDDLTRLEAVRNRLEGRLEVEEDGTKLAALSREFRAVLAEIQRLGGGKAKSRVDDLAARRTQRIAATKSPDSPAIHE